MRLREAAEAVVTAAANIRRDWSTGQLSGVYGIADAIDALRAALAAEDWQPISTAPKDGDEVLGWDPTDFKGLGGVIVMFWRGGAWWDSGLSQASPSHWMPLPDRPREGLASRSMTDDGSVTDGISGESHPSPRDGRSG